MTEIAELIMWMFAAAAHIGGFAFFIVLVGYTFKAVRELNEDEDDE